MSGKKLGNSLQIPKTAGPDAIRGITSADIVALAKSGHIRIEISGRNFRRITILRGPHAGKTTAPNPDPDAAVWRAFGPEADAALRPSGHGLSRRGPPSLPRALTNEELST